MDLHGEIERLFDLGSDVNRQEALPLFTRFKSLLNRGEVRAAEPSGATWQVNHWVKKGILLGFRIGELVDASIGFSFFDKDTYPLKTLQPGDGVRVVPGGSSIRDGSYMARGVVCMPPMYVNVGAYVDEDTMIDSHALVGSCAQIGKRVHLSAASQIGGVLEPVGAMPVIVEDDVFVGGNCGVYEGTIVRRRAVLAAGIILTGGTQVYDLVNETVYKKEGATPLIIPENAVLVPGSRVIRSSWAASHGLSIATPIIVKYRDDRTGASTALEESLR